MHRRPRRRRNPGIVQKLLFQQPVLADAQNLRPRAHRPQARQQCQALRRNILKLKRHHIHRLGKPPQRRLVGIIRHGIVSSHLRRRPKYLRREYMRGIPQPRRRHGGHPPQLPAADNPNHRPRS